MLISLVLLVLVGLALAAAARTSTADALAADDAQRQLQARWAAISCQYTLLPRCEQLLDRVEAEQHRPLYVLRTRLALGMLNLDLVLSDEQAKTNVPALLVRSRGDVTHVTAELRRLVDPLGAARLVAVRKIDTPGEPAANVQAAWLAQGAGLGEIFDLTQPGAAQIIGPTADSQGAAALLTCWGDGRLNWRRASKAALQLALRPPMNDSQIVRLQSLAQTGVTLSRALDQLNLLQDQRSAAGACLTDQSLCHGLWITAYRSAPADSVEPVQQQPFLCRQAIVDQSQPQPTVQCFDW